jgi:hypothetical protein
MKPETMNPQPDFFSELKILITDYFDARINLFKLEAFEKTAKVTAALFSLMVMALLAFFLLFFMSMSAGFYLGNLFGSMGLGFLAVTGFYLLLFALVLFKRKAWIENKVVDTIIEELTRKEDNNEPES